ncbi:DUF2953 domain-containing protein [Salirhabdus sp. Marseille-P4669]|uniref:DUF2953 domain-containing protein n=1 Tax=Salirhabdus sp. Marseille-P4669 TaxID=2042310 RepID=UPI000C7CFE16|nr:DUF2953 domain-containing protein [Salirhabdus sp. Marseille-P4669]
MTWLIILGIITLILVFIVFAILFTRLHIDVLYVMEESTNEITIKVRFWHFFTITRSFTLEDMVELENLEMTVADEEDAEDNKIKTIIKKWKVLFKRIQKSFPPIKNFLHKVFVYKLEWDTEIGLKDASSTGITTGVIWGLKGAVIGWMDQVLNVKGAPELSVTPHFHQIVFKTKIHCMFSFKVGQAMYAFMHIARNWEDTSEKQSSAI